MISLLLTTLFLTGKFENPNNSFPNLTGGTGVLRSFTAIPNKPTTFGAGFIGNFFAQDPFINNLKNSRNQFRLNGHYTFDLSLPLEVFTGMNFTYNDNSSSTSATTMTTFFENLDAGVRIGNALIDDRFYIGGYGYLRLLSGTRALRNTSGGLTGYSGPLASGALGLATTLDLTKDLKSLPVRQHFNIGYRLPNGNLARANDDFNRFALDVYKYHALAAAIAVELAYDYVTPFIEYSGEYALTSGGDSVAAKDNRHKATFGARITPLKSFSVLAAMDWGLNGPPAAKAVGIPRNPDFDFFVGLTFQAFGEALSGNFGSVRGAVTDEKTTGPLPNATITVLDAPVAPMTSDDIGRYEFPRLRNGTYQIQVQKEGYDTLTKSVSIRDGSDSLADFALKVSGPKMGEINLSVVDVNGLPIQGAIVRIDGIPSNLSTDERGQTFASNIVEGSRNISVEASGYISKSEMTDILPSMTNSKTITLEKEAPKIGICSGEVKNAEGTPLTAVLSPEDGVIKPFGTDPLTGGFSQTLPIGSHRIRVQAENYMPQVVTCDVTPESTGTIQITLEKPKEATLVGDKIILPDAIYFDFGKASIKKESNSTLDQVAAILIKEKGYKTLQVEGHTDDVGSDKFNQKLSESRAKSVKRYLSLKGVSAKKIEAIGYGEGKPVSTNLTPEGRSENRRVEFNIVRE